MIGNQSDRRASDEIKKSMAEVGKATEEAVARRERKRMGVGTLRLLLAAALFCAGGLGLHGAWAQTDEALPPAPPEVRDDAPVGTPGAGSLSERLDRSKGVIVPPAATATTDPGIVKPTPDTGATAMPVIPPPGTPGGDPNVRPK